MIINLCQIVIPMLRYRQLSFLFTILLNMQHQPRRRAKSVEVGESQLRLSASHRQRCKGAQTELSKLLCDQEEIASQMTVDVKTESCVRAAIVCARSIKIRKFGRCSLVLEGQIRIVSLEEEIVSDQDEERETSFIAETQNQPKFHNFHIDDENAQQKSVKQL